MRPPEGWGHPTPLGSVSGNVGLVWVVRVFGPRVGMNDDLRPGKALLDRPFDLLDQRVCLAEADFCIDLHVSLNEPIGARPSRHEIVVAAHRGSERGDSVLDGADLGAFESGVHEPMSGLDEEPPCGV